MFSLVCLKCCVDLKIVVLSFCLNLVYLSSNQTRGKRSQRELGNQSRRDESINEQREQCRFFALLCDGFDLISLQGYFRQSRLRRITMNKIIN